MNVNAVAQKLRTDKDYRVDFARKSPFFFIQWYMPHKLIRPTDKKRLRPALPHSAVCDAATRSRILVMFARGMGKSTLKNMLYVWRICTDPDGRGGRLLLDFTNAQTVTRSVREVSTELLFNKLIIKDFGKLMDSSCKMSLEKQPEINTKNGWGIIGKSVESGIRGLHPAEIDIDDVLDRDQIQNPDLRKKVSDIYFYDVQGMMFPGFRERFWGTPMHPEDLISRLYKSENEWAAKFRFPSEYIDSAGNRKPMWPDMWTLEDLDRIRVRLDRGSPGAYQQEYLLKPFLSANLLWTPDMIQYWNRRPPHHDMVVHTGIDLAYGVREENSETAISSWGFLTRTTDWADQGMIFELQTDKGHFTPDQTVNITLQHCRKYNFKNIIRAEDKVWANALQSMLREGCNRLGVSPSSMHYEPVKVGPGEDKKTRAMMVIQFWKDGLVFHDIDSPVAEQMLNFTGRRNEKIDAVDATVHAVSGFIGKQLYKNSDDDHPNSFCREIQYDTNMALR